MSYFSIPLYSRQHFGVFRFPFGSDEGHATTWEDLVWARGDIQTALSSPLSFLSSFCHFFFRTRATLICVRWNGLASLEWCAQRYVPSWRPLYYVRSSMRSMTPRFSIMGSRTRAKQVPDQVPDQESSPQAAVECLPEGDLAVRSQALGHHPRQPLLQAVSQSARSIFPRARLRQVHCVRIPPFSTRLKVPLSTNHFSGKSMKFLPKRLR
ncbi:hypothetical protein V2G26_019636 [Clonostachys chloroleuca]